MISKNSRDITHTHLRDLVALMFKGEVAGAREIKWLEKGLDNV